MTSSFHCEQGDRIKLVFEGREFEAIVVDPNGLGEGQPSVGFGLRMAERHIGIAQSTLSRWVIQKDGYDCLELPSGKSLRVMQIFGADRNSYTVIEASDWFDLAADLIVNPGKTDKSLKRKLVDFIRWFAIKGFYAEAYTAIKGVYTAKDSRATTKWMEARNAGVLCRKRYTDFLQQNDPEGRYAKWTDHVYLGLFGLRKAEMVRVWECVSGDSSIGRNYIPEEEGLRAVAYVEDMTPRLYVDDLDEAHNAAIKLALRKFKL
jgi:hypothetical protein